MAKYFTLIQIERQISGIKKFIRLIKGPVPEKVSSNSKGQKSTDLKPKAGRERSKNGLKNGLKIQNTDEFTF